MNDIRTIINRRIEKLEAEQTELKLKKEILDDVLANDTQLTNIKEDLVALNRSYKLEKEIILNEPENRKLLDDIKDIKTEIKDLKALLTGELLSYYHETGSLEIDDGEDLIRISFTGRTQKTDQPELFGGEDE